MQTGRFGREKVSLTFGCLFPVANLGFDALNVDQRGSAPWSYLLADV